MPSRFFRRLDVRSFGTVERCVGLLLLLTAPFTAPAAAAPPGDDWLRVLEESDAGVTLELRAAEPVREASGWTVPGFDRGGEPGMPVRFERGAWLGVPGVHGARLEILETAKRDLGKLEWPRLQGVARRADRLAAEAAGRSVPELHDVPARAFASAWPAAFVELGPGGDLRGRAVVPLTFHPVQIQPDGNVSAVTLVRVRITFADRVRVAPAALGATPEPLHTALINAASAAHWALAAPTVASAARAPRVAALPAQRLRIKIAARGIYELSYAELKAAGVGVDQPAFDPRTLRIYFDRWKPQALVADSTGSWQPSAAMRQAAIWVPGEGDGSFTSNDPNDRVVFYALGPEGYEIDSEATVDSLAYFRHPFDRNQYAWLVWGDGVFGARMSSVVTPSVPGDSVVTTVTNRTHVEQDLDFARIDDLWIWQEIRDTRPLRVQFQLDLGGQASAVGALRLALGFDEVGVQQIVDPQLNGVTLPRISFGATEQAHLQTFSGVALQAVNNLDLSIPTGVNAARITDLLEFDVVWARPLAASAAHVLDWTNRAPRDGVAYELTGFGANAPTAFDVTDPWSPRVLSGLAPQGTGAATTWQVHGTGAAHARAHYVAVGDLALGGAIHPAARDLALRSVVPLRARTTAPDMLIVTHSSLRAAADRLAQYRRGHFPGGGSPDILVADVADIYDNFSGGRVDPIAIRNYAKFLYNLDVTPRLRYLALFGDATHDVRQLRGASALTLVPTVQGGYYGIDRAGWVADYAVDDWLGELGTPPPGANPYPIPDLAIGRIPARTAADADRIVDKLIAYEAAPLGAWRTRVLLAADDECSPRGGCGETFHTDNSEDLARQVPANLHVVKYYETEYPSILGQKPLARAAFIKTWNEGCAVLNFQGHGAPRQLTDEVLFLSTDIPSLVNGAKAPLFLPISCTVSEFDDPERQSMCEDLFADPAGGAIATVGATTLTFVGSNLQFNQALFRELFLEGATGRIPLGTVQQLAKTRTTNSNTESYVLIGDPSMTLDFPQNLVRFVAGADSLETGHRTQITGEVVTSQGDVISGFDGTAEVLVFGTADESGFLLSPPQVPPHVQIYIPYDLPGPPLYRGTVPVQNGRLSFQFIVPKSAHAGRKAHISAYASSPAADATGAQSGVNVAIGATSDSSTGVPRIAMHFPNNRTRVKAGTILTADIHDENGIGIQGTSLPNSILLDFDGRNESLNVTSLFQYAAGSDSAGTLNVPLPSDLEAGAHSVTLIASDNLGNQATATIEFQVVDAEVVRLVNVLAFPNPFRDWTRFFFEITDPAEVELRVFTTSGREIWHHRQRFDAGTQASIRWEGVDLRHDAVANGTYLYRLRARPDRAGVAPLETVGKVVIMR